MTLFRNLIPIILLAACAAAGAAEIEVKVIALFTNKALLLVDGEQKIVKRGETFKGVTLRSASGRGAVVEIDGQKMKLRLNQSIGHSFSKPERSAMKIFPDALGMYYVRGKINGKPTNFLVDTGATFVTLSGALAKKLKIDFRRRGQVGTAQTAASVVRVYQVRLDSVSIGGIRASGVEAMVIPGNAPPEVLLGNSFLKHTQIEKTGTALQIKKRF